MKKNLIFAQFFTLLCVAFACLYTITVQAKEVAKKPIQQVVEKQVQLPVLKVEVFPFEQNYMTHEYAYSTVNPEHSVFCETQDRKYFGKKADEYITSSDLVGCILKQEGDTEKEVSIALKHAVDNLRPNDEKKLRQSYQQWVQLRDMQCELSGNSLSKLDKESEKYLIKKSCINFWNKQYIMFLKTI